MLLGDSVRLSELRDFEISSLVGIFLGHGMGTTSLKNWTKNSFGVLLRYIPTSMVLVKVWIS